jgi:hypothetical protein
MPNDVATLVARIRARVNITDVTVLPDVEILESINDAQELIVQAGDEWQSMDQTVTVSYDATTDGVTLPSAVQKIETVSELVAGADVASRRNPLSRVERQAWFERVNAPDVDQSYPRPAITGSYYYVWAGRLYVVPQPSAAISILIDFYGPPIDLTLALPNTSNYFVDRFFRTLKWGALADIWDHLGQEDMAELARMRFERRLDRARAVDTAARVGSGGKRIRGA